MGKGKTLNNYLSASHFQVLSLPGICITNTLSAAYDPELHQNTVFIVLMHIIQTEFLVSRCVM